MLVRLPCLEPSMTTTTRPPRPPVPPSADPAVLLSLPDAEALGERIQAQAAVVAGATCQFLLLLADFDAPGGVGWRSEEHTSELQSRGHLVCRLLLEKKKSDSIRASVVDRQHNDN